ncbi:hypothetical protein RHSIM_Rhsim03G0025700 [Rhododendron simsii]|uniref:ARM repeat superfamily protein n=1 Tax=Rhododendron simsii TaxID=118357 RepID=A0A834LSV1_RHOSS|nr:hypothetical protein RHSIM_Rhsim03G0025700 [Rhododendron simsii]
MEEEYYVHGLKSVGPFTIDSFINVLCTPTGLGQANVSEQISSALTDLIFSSADHNREWKLDPLVHNMEWRSGFQSKLIRSDVLQWSENASPLDNLAVGDVASSDYDEGSHNVSVELSGIWKADLPQHKRVRVAGDRFQKDWSISEVVQRVLGTKHWQDIEGLLNRWVGRFTRKNFPVLIRNQKNYCAQNDIYNMMIRRKPDAETFNALVNVHGRAGQWRWAMNIMDDMLRAAVCILIVIYGGVADKGGVCGSSRGMKAVVNGVMVVVVMWCGDANCGIVRIMGYLSGSSPHIKSGAVSALSVLVHNNAEICLLVPDLVPSVLALLQTKAVEVIKNRHGKASSKESSAADMEPEVLESSPRRMRWKRKREEPSIPSEEDGKVESRFRKRGMKLVKKAGSHTADRQIEGQSRGNARNKRNFNGYPIELKQANKAHERKKKILRG